MPEALEGGAVLQHSIVSGGRRRPRADFDLRASKAASGFSNAFGIRPGDAVALLLRNDIAFLEATTAAGIAGAYSVPVNWHFKAEEVEYIIRDCAAKLLIVHRDLLGAIKDVPAKPPILVVETPSEILAAYPSDATTGSVPTHAGTWDEWIPTQEVWSGGPHVSPGSMIYTSGTTGRPKGVRRPPPSPAQAEAAALTATFGYGLAGTVRTVLTGPLYHSAPFSYATRTLQLGGSVVLQPRFDAEQLLGLIEAERITHLHLVPIMFVRLLRLPEHVRQRHDLSSLRFVAHGAAPCPEDVKRRMIDWWGPVIHEYYGSTETGLVSGSSSEEWLARPGTVGTPLPGVRIRILGRDREVLPANTTGDIFVRNDDVVPFDYHGRNDLRASIEHDGWVTLGDVGHVDDDGYLYISDRSRDMVISGGVNVYHAEIEAAIHTLAGVQDCAVFGIPDEEYGERLAAVVQVPEGSALTPGMVVAHLRPILARYKLPTTIDLRPALPREDSGKIRKRDLRQPYWERSGRRI